MWIGNIRPKEGFVSLFILLCFCVGSVHHVCALMGMIQEREAQSRFTNPQCRERTPTMWRIITMATGRTMHSYTCTHIIILGCCLGLPSIGYLFESSKAEYIHTQVYGVAVRDKRSPHLQTSCPR